MPHALIVGIRSGLMASFTAAMFISVTPGMKIAQGHLVRFIGWVCLLVDAVLLITDATLRPVSHAVGVFVAATSLFFGWLEYRAWRDNRDDDDDKWKRRRRRVSAKAKELAARAKDAVARPPLPAGGGA